MKRTARHTKDCRTHSRISIPGLLLTKGFDATLSFFCTLCIFSLD